MPFRWWPSLTVMIHQQRIVWICAISSSCTEYVIISKHLWIVIAPWLRLSLSIKSSFITLICRTTIFHSDCLAWIFISVLFFPPPTHHCSLFISLKKKKKERKKNRAPVTHMAETTSVTGTCTCAFAELFYANSAPWWVFINHLLRSHGCLYCSKSQSSNLVPLICWVFQSSFVLLKPWWNEGWNINDKSKDRGLCSLVASLMCHWDQKQLFAFRQKRFGSLGKSK